MVVSLGEAALDAETIRRTAEQVLSRPEYRVPGPSLRERVIDWLSEQIGRLLLAAGDGPGSLLAGLGLLLLVAAVALLAVRFARTLRHDPSRQVVVSGPAGRRAQDWAADAAAHEAAGRWREALRCRYRELLAGLADAGLVTEVPGRTTGEYAAAVAAALPAAREPFGRLSRVFEEVWYGGRPAGPDALGAAAAAARTVRAAAGLPEPAATPGRPAPAPAEVSP